MTTQYLFNEVEYEEGLKLKPYKDKFGIWSIGIGHNIQADPEMNKQLAQLQRDGITEDQARALFANDVQGKILDLDIHIPWWRTLDDVRQNVLVNICFNVGCGQLLTWHHTLDAFQSHNWSLAAANLQSTRPWADQVPNRARRLVDQVASGKSSYGY